MTEPKLTSADRDALASFMERGYLVAHAAPSAMLVGAMLDALEATPGSLGRRPAQASNDGAAVDGCGSL